MFMASMCVMCDKQLGSSFVRNEWGENYCASHSHIAGCLWCGSHKQLRIEHGIHACGDCWDEVIEEDSEVADCAERVMNWLATIIGPHDLQSVPVVYGGLTIPPPTGGTLGWTLSTWKGNVGSAEISTVGHMPRSAFMQLLAHEYGHVLLIFDPHTFQLHPNIPKEDLVVEGFCEVVASEFLQHVGDDRSLKLLNRMGRNRNAVYGDGFRRMLPEMNQAGGIVPLCMQLTGWNPKFTISATAPTSDVPEPISPSVPTSASSIPDRPSIPVQGVVPKTSPVQDVPTRDSEILMRPIVKRTDKPQTVTEHRPHIVMTKIVNKPIGVEPSTTESGRPSIPMKPRE